MRPTNYAFSRGQYAQDIFTVRTAYLEGKPPKSVNMYWRRFALSSIPIDDPVAFEVWLRARWMEKDGLIEAYYRHGRFPADRGAHKESNGKIVRGAGHIETEIKSNYWYEFLQIFAPVGVLALVLYMFYNALPAAYTRPLNRQSAIEKVEQLQRTPVTLQKQQLLTRPAKNAAGDQDSLAGKAMTMYTDLSKNAAVRKVVQLPELSEKGLQTEMMKHQSAVDTIFTQKNALQDLKTKLAPGRAPQSLSQRTSRVVSHTKGNSSSATQAIVPQIKAGQLKTNAPSQAPTTLHTPSLQKSIPAKSTATKPAAAKTTTPKQLVNQSRPPKLTNGKAQTQVAAAPKLQSKINQPNAK
jgi:Acyltransferase C-terminus